MKRRLEKAAALFRENEALAGGDPEKTNLYRGLSLLAEGLSRLEKELDDIESEAQNGPSHFFQQPAASATRDPAGNSKSD